MNQIFTGRDFIVQSDVAPSGEGICPLYDESGEQLGDINDLIRISTKLGDGWPESFVDQGNGSYMRLSLDGMGYGTSVVGSPSFRSYAAMHFIPTPQRITVGGSPDEFRIASEGIYRERDLDVATVKSFRTWHRPKDGVGSVVVDIRTELHIHENIPISTATEFIQKDRFRWYMLSSMYVNDITYDSNLLRFENAAGESEELSISQAYNVNNSKRFDGHLFQKAKPIKSWLELAKTTGSSWLPKSPSIRYDIKAPEGMELGLQAWWSGSDNPDDDNLNVWLEWLNPPRKLEQGAVYGLDVKVTSNPCLDQAVAISKPAFPKSLWWKPTDYSHRMEYHYASEDS